VTTTTQARSDGAGATRSETQRADELMHDAEERMEDFGERFGRWLSRAAARAREEAEDIWAEAQDLRRGR
jgi:hypothetical protein